MRLSIYILLALLVGCSKGGNTHSSVEVLLSKEPSMLLHIQQKDQFVSQTINHDFWKEYFKYYPNGNVQNLLRSLPMDKDIWVAYTHEGVYLSCRLPEQDSLSPWKAPSLGQLDSITLENKKWYYLCQDHKLLIGSLKDLSFLTEEEEETATATHESFYKLAKTTSEDVPANMFLSPKKNKEFVGGIFSPKLVEQIGDWTAWDIFLEKQTLRLSGSSLHPSDSIAQLPLTQPKKNTLESALVIPQTANNIEAFAFDEALIPTEFYFDFQPDISSVAFFSFAGDSLATLHSENPNETLRYFTILKTETFQGVSLYQIEELSDVQSFFAIFGHELAPKFIYKHEEDLIFAQKKEALQQLINTIQLKQSLTDQRRFGILEEKSNSQTAFVAIENLSEHTAFAKKYPALGARYGYASLQISPQENFYQLTLTTTADKGEAALADSGTTHVDSQEGSALLQERFQIILDKDAHTLPRFVTNHRTGEREVVIQDTDNQLYLIGHDGKILWKKRLDSPIVGDIYQVDLFRNGFLQLAFNTQYSSYVIDRNGKEVMPFCHSYKNPLLPLQIFDYDNNKDYRFVICDFYRIRLKDRKGEEIKGFEGELVPVGIKATPQHMRLAGKDFIVFPKADNHLSILHRNGTVRIPLSQTFAFSDNPIRAYKDYITFTTKDGKQYYIDSNGGLRQESLGVGEGHYFDVLGDTQVVLSGNTLRINQKKIELPYADYSRPRLVATPKGLVILVLDEQNHQLYLINTQGEIYPHFPIFALSQADVTQENGKLLLTFLKEKNTVTVVSEE